jgi:hypothetical protein
MSLFFEVLNDNGEEEEDAGSGNSSCHGPSMHGVRDREVTRPKVLPFSISSLGYFNGVQGAPTTTMMMM